MSVPRGREGGAEGAAASLLHVQLQDALLAARELKQDIQQWTVQWEAGKRKRRLLSNFYYNNRDICI